MSNKFDGMWGREIKEQEQPQPPQPETPARRLLPERVWLRIEQTEPFLAFVPIFNPAIHRSELDTEYIRADLAAERPADEDERVKAAREDEREQCAKIAETCDALKEDCDDYDEAAIATAARYIAFRIRRRSEHVGE